MMGGLAVAWQVKVTRSPSRTERGSMDKVTVGGSVRGHKLILCWQPLRYQSLSEGPLPYLGEPTTTSVRFIQYGNTQKSTTTKTLAMMIYSISCSTNEMQLYKQPVSINGCFLITDLHHDPLT